MAIFIINGIDFITQRFEYNKFIPGLIFYVSLHGKRYEFYAETESEFGIVYSK